jgi:membrane-bound hydrogenase subunit beta
MAETQDIQAELANRFPFMAERLRFQRERRLYAWCPPEKLAEVFEYLYRQMKFTMLSAITAIDEGATLGMIYHLDRESGVVLSLSTSVPRDNPVIQSVTPYFPAADVYEREAVDLMGLKVEGLPPGSRYPLPDNWPAGEYPLRKDWKPKDSVDGAGGEEAKSNG